MNNEITRPTVLMVSLFYGIVRLRPDWEVPIYINPIDIDCTGYLANSYDNEIISGTVTLTKDDLVSDLFDIEFTVASKTDGDKPYIPDPSIHDEYKSKKYGNADILGFGKLVSYNYLEPSTDILGHVLLGYSNYAKDIIQGRIAILKQEVSSEIDCTLTLAKDEINEDLFDIEVYVPKFVVNVDMDIRIIVPKFRVQYTFPIDIEVVRGACANLPIELEVVNDYLWDILDGTVSLPKIDIEDSIEGHVILPPEVWEDLDCTASIKKLATYRELDCSGYLISATITDIPIDIETEAYEEPVYEFSEDIISGIVHFGGRTNTDIVSISLTTTAADKIEKDILECIAHLRDYKRIGIVVDPRWSYDPFVFKSCILTLFDKYYNNTILDIVYGGNPRSDWDIEHLGYVFKNKLTKVPIVFDRINPERTKRSIEHYIYHLSSMDVAKVFLFTDRPDYIASNPLSLITQYCKDNGIEFAIITSHGEFVEYRDNQAYSTTRDPLRAEPHSVLGPLSVMPLNHFNKIAQPSNPEHPYYHPDRIIY